MLDNVYRYVERDPYRAYKAYINEFYHDMAGGGVFTFYLPYWLPLAAAALSMVLFVMVTGERMFLSIRSSRKGISREAAEAGEAVTAGEEATAVIMAAAVTAGSRKRRE